MQHVLSFSDFNGVFGEHSLFHTLGLMLSILSAPVPIYHEGLNLVGSVVHSSRMHLKLS